MTAEAPPKPLTYTEQVVQEVAKERQNHKLRWSDAHDDEHTPAEWMVLLTHLVTRSAFKAYVSIPVVRKDLIKVAATAIAAVEALDRRERREEEEEEEHD